MFKKVAIAAIIWVITGVARAQSPPPRSSSPTSAPKICSKCVRAHMEFLASDALRGRGSGTQDEWIAATYIASELEQYGVAPAGDEGGYIQRATLSKRQVTGPPQITLKAESNGAQQTWIHGKDVLVLHLGGSSFSGPLHKVDAENTGAAVPAGSVVFVMGKAVSLEEAAARYGSKGAVAVVAAASERLITRWDAVAGRPLHLPIELQGQPNSDLEPSFTLVAVNASAAEALSRAPEGSTVSMTVPASEPQTSHTWNVVAKLAGTDPAHKNEVILLTAHLDHLGVAAPVNGDAIYNGADDDASGSTAVLELARVLATRAKPRRTVIFAWFGSEEMGGLGSSYFRQHPPVPLKDIAAYLEFEMIGRADPAVREGELWLTGWERSDLGPALAAHGAHLVPDPHPDQQFFSRSDNYVFAKQGVVAQTVSSYGLHRDYHQPSDDVGHIDFQHMDEAIGSMLRPVLWLVNSNFVPHWKEGGKP